MGRWLAAVATGAILIGTLAGESTVAAMSITRGSGDGATAIGYDRNDEGARWAERNHPGSADACPGPSAMFQSACVAATTN